MKTIFKFLFVVSAVLFVQCKEEATISVSHLGEINHPKDNLSSEAKISLGKKLFFDKRLSLNDEISCASCHVPEKAFTDGRQLGQGIQGRIAFRNTPSLFNVGYSPTFMFDAEIKSLEEQVLVPILDHNEMGVSMRQVIDKLKVIPEYQKAAKQLYNRNFDAWVLTRSIASYERTLISDNSDFDKFYYQQNSKAISESAKRGWKLFSGRLNCVQCHPAPFFTDFKPHNNGRTELIDSDLGRYRINSDSTEIGYFKTPSLRNSSITAPYMHNGELKTLEKVIEYYGNGGGGGYNQENAIRPFSISKAEKNDLVNFLKSLEGL